MSCHSSNVTNCGGGSDPRYQGDSGTNYNRYQGDSPIATWRGCSWSYSKGISTMIGPPSSSSEAIAAFEQAGNFKHFSGFTSKQNLQPRSMLPTP